jgi:hypothetical protein
MIWPVLWDWYSDSSADYDSKYLLLIAQKRPVHVTGLFYLAYIQGRYGSRVIARSLSC